ncbi:MAG: hypothetical protein ACI4IT_04210, partial [Oscillospiraceae bacterium]
YHRLFPQKEMGVIYKSERHRRRNAEDGVPYGLALIRRLTATPSPEGKAMRADNIRPYGLESFNTAGAY